MIFRLTSMRCWSGKTKRSRQKSVTRTVTKPAKKCKAFQNDITRKTAQSVATQGFAARYKMFQYGSKVSTNQKVGGSNPFSRTMASGLIAFEKCCKTTRFLYAQSDWHRDQGQRSHGAIPVFALPCRHPALVSGW